MFGFGDPVAKAREKAARTARGPLADYYAVPVQPPSTPASELRLLAIDIETTGLDAGSDAVLSIGYLPVDGDTIVLGGAANLVLQGASVGQSATIHGLTDDVIEVGFLSRACVELYGAPFVTPSIDTMHLQRRIVAPGFNDEPRADDLRLWTARARFRLPRYGAHQATTDALACAELYLAQLAELRGTPTLKSLSG